MSSSDTKVESNTSSVETQSEQRQRTESEGNESNPDIHFDPIIQLPLVDIQTLEENETELLKVRAKLYRYDTTEEVPQFKERGTGEVKILRHKHIRAVRILMRRDKTLKLCANHYIMPSMELKNHSNSDRVFVWSTFADLSEETPKPETLAIRFGSVENAQKFKDVFEESKKFVSEDVSNEISNNLKKINLRGDEENSSEESDSDNESEEEEEVGEGDKNEVKSEEKNEVKSEDKCEVKSEDKNEVKSEDKCEVKSEDKNEVKSEDKNEVKSEDKNEDKETGNKDKK